MIIGPWAHWLNVLSTALLLWLCLIAIQLLTYALVHKVSSRLAPAERKWLILSWCSLPWLVALLMFIQGAIPESSDRGVTQGILGLTHWHHVDVFAYNAWHSWVVVAAGSWLLWLVAKAFARQWTSLRWLRQLHLHTEFDERLRVYVLPTREVLAMTAGWLQPLVYVSQGLLDKASSKQLSIIVSHEQAHAQYRDNLTRLLMSFLVSPLPTFVRKPLMREFTLVTEQLADQAVAQTHEPADVAQTMVDILRLGQLGISNKVAAFVSKEQVALRVTELLRPVHQTRFFRFMTTLMFVTLAFASLQLSDGLHHALDALWPSHDLSWHGDQR